MLDVTISYVLTTRNKLPYLREVLSRLLSNVEPGDEIVVVDGGSTDGTREYLERLFGEGKIHYLVSERDSGEAHGYNKGILAARGEVIKLLTDDDAFHYPSIRRCSRLLVEHPDIDALGTDAGYVKDYLWWKRFRRPFSFCGLGLQIRRRSIPLIGLLSTCNMRVDLEYAYRLTSSKASLAWFTGSCYRRFFNPQSNSNRYWNMYREHSKCLRLYRPQAYLLRFRTWWMPYLIGVKRLVVRRRSILQKDFSQGAIRQWFCDADREMELANQSDPGEFLLPFS